MKQRQMLCLTAIVATGAIMGGLTASSAKAGTDTLPVQYPIAVKLGLGFPAQRQGNNAAFYGGASYDFSKTTADSPVIFQVYGDDYTKSGASLFGIGVAAQFMLGNALSPTKPYVGVGIGDYITHVSGSSSKSNFGGKVFAGYDFTQTVFGEVDYQLTQKNNGANPDAFGVRAGYRF